MKMLFSILFTFITILTCRCNSNTITIDDLIAHGNQLKREKKYEQASHCFLNVVNQQPEHPTALSQLAACYYMSGRMEEALDIYKELTRLNPADNRSLYNLGCVLKTMGRMHEAIRVYEQVIQTDPDYHMAHIGLSKAYLAVGQFERGWQEFEWRYGNRKKFKQKKLDINNFAGKTVLVQSEWGLGDTIQFFRYAQLLKQAGATVIVQTASPLVQLFSLCDYVDYVFCKQMDTSLAIDITIPMLSLPLIFQTREETIPSSIPYLQADNNLVQFWDQHLTKGTINVGLCWQAKPGIFLEEQPRTRRSIPLQQFAPLAQIKGVTFYSLQQQYGIEQLKNLPDGFVVKTFGPDFDNTHGRFMDTAAVIKNLDLIISVDTSIVHLAGGLGAQVWVALPHAAEWRWMLEREDTPWYPGMRIFRQPAPGDWNSVIKKIKTELEKVVN